MSAWYSTHSKRLFGGGFMSTLGCRFLQNISLLMIAMLKLSFYVSAVYLKHHYLSLRYA